MKDAALSNRVEHYSIVRLISVMGKFRISISVAFTSFVSYVVCARNVDIGSLYLMLGVFFVASASACINHIQERDIDQKMTRTMYRPLPAGVISISEAWTIAAIFFLLGAFVLLKTQSLLVLILTLVTLFWYNYIYTPLKRRFAMAIIPGALTGVFPPVIGWLAACGKLDDRMIVLLALFFFVAQIPHFWLLLVKYGNEYEMANLPSLTQVLTKKQLLRITLIWIFTTILVQTCLVVFVVRFCDMFQFISYLASFGLVTISILAFFKSKNWWVSLNFHALNFYVLIFVSLLLGQSLLF